MISSTEGGTSCFLLASVLGLKQSGQMLHTGLGGGGSQVMQQRPPRYPDFCQVCCYKFLACVAVIILRLLDSFQVYICVDRGLAVQK